jgi:hypothetical protein
MMIHIVSCGPPLWSSGQGYWLQIHRSGFDSQSYQIFWEVVGLERSSLSLGSRNEKMLERENSGSGVESRKYDRRYPSRRPRGTLYPQKLALTSLTSGGLSVGMDRSRTQATELVIIYEFGTWHIIVRDYPPFLYDNRILRNLFITRLYEIFHDLEFNS